MHSAPMMMMMTMMMMIMMMMHARCVSAASCYENMCSCIAISVALAFFKIDNCCARCGLYSHMDQQWQRPPMKLVPLEPTESIQLQNNHSRAPDIGMRIHVTMPYEDGPQRKEYIGEYCGHGQSKTAFILNGAPGDPYDGKILKVTANPDNEPHVFTEMTVRSPGTALRILYNSLGVANLEQRHYCWITERTIPLDQFLSGAPDVAPDRCILAAIMCVAECARNGLRLSDCNFFNLGVLVNSEEQHRLVAIDAGSYVLGDPKSYSKGECNQQVARKIWKHAESCNAPYDYVKRLWQSRQSLPEAIAVLHEEWMRRPYLSREKKTTAQIEQQMKGDPNSSHS